MEGRRVGLDFSRGGGRGTQAVFVRVPPPSRNSGPQGQDMNLISWPARLLWRRSAAPADPGRGLSHFRAWRAGAPARDRNASNSEVRLANRTAFAASSGNGDRNPDDAGKWRRVVKNGLKAWRLTSSAHAATI